MMNPAPHALLGKLPISTRVSLVLMDSQRRVLDQSHCPAGCPVTSCPKLQDKPDSILTPCCQEEQAIMDLSIDLANERIDLAKERIDRAKERTAEESAELPWREHVCRDLFTHLIYPVFDPMGKVVDLLHAGPFAKREIVGPEWSSDIQIIGMPKEVKPESLLSGLRRIAILNEDERRDLEVGCLTLVREMSSALFSHAEQKARLAQVNVLGLYDSRLQNLGYPEPVKPKARKMFLKLDKKNHNEAHTMVEHQFISDYSDATTGRLTSEAGAIRRESILDLVIGTAFAVGLFLYLAYVIMGRDATFGSNSLALMWHYAQRITIVAAIGYFASFFLRKYKAGWDYIRFYQNEMTTMHAKALALRGAIAEGDMAATEAVVKQLSTTERNFVLRRGETTVEVERERIESAGASDMVSAMMRLLGRTSRLRKK